MNAARRELVVLVHGLYVHGLWMGLLESWLDQAGYETVNYSYPTMTRSPAENAEDLEKLLERLEAPTIHFLAHSMGGLVVRHLFHNYPHRKPGRVVTLGTPHQGSYAAQIMDGVGLGFCVGRGLEGGLLGDGPSWTASHQLGSIAGTSNVGFGLVFPGMPERHGRPHLFTGFPHANAGRSDGGQSSDRLLCHRTVSPLHAGRLAGLARRRLRSMAGLTEDSEHRRPRHRGGLVGGSQLDGGIADMEIDRPFGDVQDR